MATKQIMLLGVVLMVAYFGSAFGIPILPEDEEGGVKGGKTSEYIQKQVTESINVPTTTGTTTVRGPTTTSSSSSSGTKATTTTTKTELSDVDLQQHALSGENKENETSTVVTSTTSKSWYNIFKRDTTNANSTESNESKSDEQQNPLIVPLRRKRWEETKSESKSEEDASEKEGSTEEETEEKEDSDSAETAEKEESLEEEHECPKKEHEEKEAEEKEGKESSEEEEEKDEKEETEEAEESKEESEPEVVVVESIELDEDDDSAENED